MTFFQYSMFLKWSKFWKCPKFFDTLKWWKVFRLCSKTFFGVKKKRKMRCVSKFACFERVWRFQKFLMFFKFSEVMRKAMEDKGKHKRFAKLNIWKKFVIAAKFSKCRRLLNVSEIFESFQVFSTLLSSQSFGKIVVVHFVSEVLNLFVRFGKVFEVKKLLKVSKCLKVYEKVYNLTCFECLKTVGNINLQKKKKNKKINFENSTKIISKFRDNL